jgi:hypothetical protein
MNPYFKDGKLYAPVRAEEDTGRIGDGVVEVPIGSEEYQAIYDLIDRHPEWQEEANWDERPAV